MIRFAFASLVAFGLTFAACSHGGPFASMKPNANDQTVCVEFRGMTCPAGASCSMDKERGCKTCRCDSVAGNVGADGNPTVNRSSQGGQ